MPCTESLSDHPYSVLLAPHLATSSMTKIDRVTSSLFKLGEAKYFPWNTEDLLDKALDSMVKEKRKMTVLDRCDLKWWTSTCRSPTMSYCVPRQPHLWQIALSTSIVNLCMHGCVHFDLRAESRHGTFLQIYLFFLAGPWSCASRRHEELFCCSVVSTWK